ncbi:MAG: DUF7768 domain-containing protein [Saccharofermentanales bacterium]
MKNENKLMVFICSPFAGDTEHNLTRARGYCRFAVSKNAIPVAPHMIFPQFMDDDDPEQRKTAIDMGLVLMSNCREVWCFGSRISNGMAVEIENAKNLRIPIRYFTDKCAEVNGNA